MRYLPTKTLAAVLATVIAEYTTSRDDCGSEVCRATTLKVKEKKFHGACALRFQKICSDIKQEGQIGRMPSARNFVDRQPRGLTVSMTVMLCSLQIDPPARVGWYLGVVVIKVVQFTAERDSKPIICELQSPAVVEGEFNNFKYEERR